MARADFQRLWISFDGCCSCTAQCVRALCVCVRSSRELEWAFSLFLLAGSAKAKLGHVAGKTFKHLIKGRCHSGGRLELEFLKFFLKSSAN